MKIALEFRIVRLAPDTLALFKSGVGVSEQPAGAMRIWGPNCWSAHRLKPRKKWKVAEWPGNLSGSGKRFESAELAADWGWGPDASKAVIDFIDKNPPLLPPVRQ